MCKFKYFHEFYSTITKIFQIKFRCKIKHHKEVTDQDCNTCKDKKENKVNQ